MNKLMDDIHRFKVRWKDEKASPLQARDEIGDLIRIYVGIGPGQDDLKRAFTKRWDRLSELRRRELVDRLLKGGHLPAEVGHALEVFGGKVTSLF